MANPLQDQLASYPPDDPGIVQPPAGPSIGAQFQNAGLSFDPSVPAPANLPSRDNPTAAPGGDLFPDTSKVAALRGANPLQQQLAVAGPESATIGYPQTQTPAAASPTTMSHMPAAAGGHGGGPGISYTQQELNRQINAPLPDSGRSDAEWMNARDRAKIASDRKTERQGMEKERGAELDARRAERDAALKEDAHASEHDYFRQENGLQHFADLLGGIAGGALQGYRGLGSNPYFDQQNKRIDRYIATQRAAHDDKVKGASTAYSDALDKYKDKQAASDAVHADVLDEMAAKVDERAAGMSDAERAQNLMQGKDALRLQAAQYRDRAAQAAAAANRPMTVKELAETAKTVAEARKLDAEANKATAEVKGVKLDKDAREANEGAALATSLQRDLAKNDGELPGTGLGGRLAQSVKEGGGLMGALAGGTQDASEVTTHAQLRQLAAATLPPTARDNPQSVDRQMQELGFTGGPEKVAAGVALAQKLLQSRTGAQPSLQQQLAGGAPPSTFRP